jgi:hypothetical protein
MSNTVVRSGRPLAGTLAAGFAGGAFAALALPEVLGPARPGPAGLAALAGVWLASLLLGAVWDRRNRAGGQPKDWLAPALGLIGLTMPLALLAARMGHLPALDRLGLPWASLAGCCPTGLFCGLALAAALAEARTHPRWRDRPAAIPTILAVSALAGAAFCLYVAEPRLSPLNTALDLTLGCAALGIVCAAGAPVASRRLETWLSLLALLTILALPLSGVLDQVSLHWNPPQPPARQSGSAGS